MKQVLAEKGKHLCLTMLMCVGFLYPALTLMHMVRVLPFALMIAFFTGLYLTLVCSHKITGIMGILLPIAGLMVYHLSSSQTSAVNTLLRAIHVSLFYDAPIALTLYADSLVIFLSILLACVAFAATSSQAGVAPAFFCLIFVCLILWQSGEVSLIPALIPVTISVGCLLAASRPHPASFARTFPAMVILSALCIGLVPLIVPQIPRLEESAEALRQQIMDYLFFTEPRSVFSLAQEGYYPEGQEQLGGPANPTEHEVMLVSTDQTVYLRGAIKNEYTGRTWLDTTGGRRYLWISSRWSDIRKNVFDETLPVEAALHNASRVSISMLTDSTSTMFVPQRIRDLSVGGALIPYFNLSSEVFATRDLQVGDSWSVLAPLYTAGQQGLETYLAQCAENADPALDESILETYTLLPNHLQPSLYQLAHEMAGTSEDRYTQALNVTRFLSSHYRYNLDVPSAPEGHDFVSYFLLVSHEGYCTYFASSLTVLLRMLGIPARYVEGYRAVPDAGGKAIVRGTDAHAWCEVYFPGFGWLTFDATPGMMEDSQESSAPSTASSDPDAMPSQSPAVSSASPDMTPQPEPERSPDPEGMDEQIQTVTPTPEPETEDSLDTPNPSSDTSDMQNGASSASSHLLLWLLIILLVIALLAWRIAICTPEYRAKRAKKEEDRFFIFLQAITDALALLKIQRLPAESLIAFSQRLEGLKLCPGLAEIYETVSLVCYAHRVPLPEETGEAKKIYRTLFEKLSILQKCRLILRRSFLPARHHLF